MPRKPTRDPLGLVYREEHFQAGKARHGKVNLEAS